MSKYKIQIETGLIGIALCLALFFRTRGNAVDSNTAHQCMHRLACASASVEDVLNEMNLELRNVREFLVTDSERIVFIARNGKRRQYQLIGKSFWSDERPMIYGIDSFHFEYRNKHGQLLTRPNRYPKEICRIHYVMNYLSGNERDYANFRIHIKRTPEAAPAQMALAE